MMHLAATSSRETGERAQPSFLQSRNSTHTVPDLTCYSIVHAAQIASSCASIQQKSATCRARHCTTSGTQHTARENHIPSIASKPRSRRSGESKRASASHAAMNELMQEQEQQPGAFKPPTGLEGLDSVTLTRFVLHGQTRHREAQGDLTLLLASVQLACKVTETCVRRAGIAKLYGLAGSGNVQGEDQKKLDIIANDTFKVNIESSEKCCVMVSEEDEMAIVCARSGFDGSAGKYAIAFDPLDGSSNIDANVSIGSIFSIYKIDDPESATTPEKAAKAILQPGSEMVAAGYAMYGSATNLVISTGDGVNGFTLDPSLGEFVLTHPNIRIPARGKIYSVNEGNAKNWDKATTEYVHSLKYPEDGKASYSLRYIGRYVAVILLRRLFFVPGLHVADVAACFFLFGCSMVADVHRTLFYGGIFIYPADKKNPTGKLRLLYEAAPMAFLIEQAGGKATTGTAAISDIVPTEIHQVRFLPSFSRASLIHAVFIIWSI